MLINTGSLALTLLLASRLTGLWRESAQSAAFGATGMGDVAVLMLTFPDWITGILVSGAMAYVLLPHWAGQTALERTQTQRRVGQWLLATAVALGVLLVFFRQPLAHLLASGLAPGLQTMAQEGLIWSAMALPAAFMAALGIARLQCEQDFVGMYAASVVVNGALIVSLYLLSVEAVATHAVVILGLALCSAMALRLVWVHVRLPAPAKQAWRRTPGVFAPLPMPSVWLWAALSSGLPLTLPLVARSFSSAYGEGGLSTFNYAWKMVELPLILAIQLVATLAFPSISQALAAEAPGYPRLSGKARQAVRDALILAWTLACAAVAALQIGAPAIASLLFGWGRMPAERLADIAAWGSAGAWGLLPQAVIAVALTVLASQRRMGLAVVAYAGALVFLLICGILVPSDGIWLMYSLNGVLAGVAMVMLYALVKNTPGTRWNLSLLPVTALGIPSLALLVFDLALRFGDTARLPVGDLNGLWLSFSAAGGILLFSYTFGGELRAALRR
jgi:peptidoglycan biosynthesis protein MviN/MurJ (putative lipid II flippase)